MTALLLAALLAASPADISRSASPRADIRVAVTDAGGAADVSLADALARTLAESGLTASPAHRRAADCGDECINVSVRKLEDHGFLVEVRGRREIARAPVRLAPSASSFDQVHALAIEAELLTDRVRALRRKRAPRAVTASAQAAPAPSPPAPPEDVETDTEERPVPTISHDLHAASADAPTVHGPTTMAAAPAAPVVLQQAPPPVAPADERLALSVAAVVLTDTARNLFMHGPTVGIRLRATHRLDVRAAASFLNERDFEHEGTTYKLGMLPLSLAAAVEIPGVPSLRLGGGAEGILVHSETGGQEAPLHWSIGPIARLEHRFAIRTFALMSALQLALHPPSWNTAGDAASLVTIPQWTVGASVGLEFKLF